MNVCRSLRFAALAAVLLPALALPAQGTVSPADTAAINAVLAGMQAAWNHHDMKAFTAYMTDDVEWVNVVGMWWRGKAQVYKAHAALHATMFKDRSLQDPASVAMRSIAPGVVIVTEIIPADGYTTASGRVVPPNRNVLTETFVRRDGKWLVAEGHNTVIDEGARAHDPGR